MLKISFPNTLYLSIYHKINSSGRFEFEFWYENNNVLSEKGDEVDGLLTKKSYSLVDIEKEVKEQEEANMMWVYIVGGFSALVIAVIIFLVVSKVRKQQSIQAIAKNEREGGLVKTWGIKTKEFS